MPGRCIVPGCRRLRSRLDFEPRTHIRWRRNTRTPSLPSLEAVSYTHLGERFNATIVRYLKFARDFNEQFPGFETDIHGLVKEMIDNKPCYYVDLSLIHI